MQTRVSGRWRGDQRYTPVYEPGPVVRFFRLVGRLLGELISFW